MGRILIVAVMLLSAAVASAEGFVVVCPVEGMIDDGVRVLVERAVKEAAGAKALVLEVDTPGGLVDAAIKITQSILSAPCPTIAYIKGMGAISAGALISFSCNHLIMTPDTNIGAATPVIPSAEGMLPTGEKEVSFMRAKMRALAERNHHNPAIGEAMVDKDIELRSYIDANGKTQIFAVYTSGSGEKSSRSSGFNADDAVRIVKKLLDETPAVPDADKKPTEETSPTPAPVSSERTPSPVPIENTQLILPAGKLLTLTPQEAIEYGLIPTTADTLNEALRYYDYGDAEIRRITPTWAEVIFRWLTNPMVSGLLLMFGIGGLYLEMKTPGAIVPAIVGFSCLALFFGAHLVLGVAEWLDVLLVVAGIILILTEVFLIPGFGAVGTAGILCLLVGLYMTLTGVTIPRYSWEFERLRNAGVSLTIAATSFAILVYVVWKLFPHTPLYGRFVQIHVQQPEKGYVVQTAEQESEAIGLKGVAASMLRPAGRGRFTVCRGLTNCGEVSYRVVSRGEYIPPGTPIVIVQVDGNRYVVDRLEERA